MAAFLAFCDDAGHWKADDADALSRHIAAKFKGQEFVLTVKAMPKRQGSQALRYYRGVVIPDLAAACGYDVDDYPKIHDAMAFKYLRLSDDEFGTPRRRSTGKDDLTQTELAHYIDQIILWAESSIPGCRIRRPEDVDLDAVYSEEFA